MGNVNFVSPLFICLSSPDPQDRLLVIPTISVCKSATEAKNSIPIQESHALYLEHPSSHASSVPVNTDLSLRLGLALV